MGIQTDNAERNWQEARQDETMKLECLKLVMEHGKDNDRSMPWNTAQRYYMWIKYGNPDLEVK